MAVWWARYRLTEVPRYHTPVAATGSSVPHPPSMENGPPPRNTLNVPHHIDHRSDDGQPPGPARQKTACEKTRSPRTGRGQSDDEPHSASKTRLKSAPTARTAEADSSCAAPRRNDPDRHRDERQRGDGHRADEEQIAEMATGGCGVKQPADGDREPDHQPGCQRVQPPLQHHLIVVVDEESLDGLVAGLGPGGGLPVSSAATTVAMTKAMPALPPVRSRRVLSMVAPQLARSLAGRYVRPTGRLPDSALKYLTVTAISTYDAAYVSRHSVGNRRCGQGRNPGRAAPSRTRTRRLLGSQRRQARPRCRRRDRRSPIGGVAATTDIDELLATDADCVMYSPPLLPDDSVVAKILRSGKNVVTPVGWVYPDRENPAVQALEQACAAGNATLHGSGIHPPGGITERFPLMISALTAAITHVRAEEFSDIRTYNAPLVVREVMGGFGLTPEQAMSGPIAALLEAGFKQSVRMVADQLGGFRSDPRIRSTQEVAVAVHGTDQLVVPMEAGTVPPGASSGRPSSTTSRSSRLR